MIPLYDDGDRTQEIVAQLPPTQQIVRKDNRTQDKFKRFCAYYGMALLVLITGGGLVSKTDIGTHWAGVLEAVVWAAGFAILGAMSADIVSALVSIRSRGK